MYEVFGIGADLGKKIRYDRPAWNVLDYFRVFLEALGLYSLIVYCFYRSFIPMLFFPAFLFGYGKIRKRQAAAKRKEKLRHAFRDAILSVSSALQVGYSLENAIPEALFELRGLFGEESDICREFAGIASGISFNQPVEDLFDDLAKRSGIDEIALFAEVVRYGKRSGGNLITIMRGTAFQLGEKIRIEQEMDAYLASGRLQEEIMCASPILILLYVDMTAPDLLTELYGTAFGVLVMTGCLAVYLAAFWLVFRISDVKV